VSCGKAVGVTNRVTVFLDQVVCQESPQSSEDQWRIRADEEEVSVAHSPIVELGDVHQLCQRLVHLFHFIHLFAQLPLRIVKQFGSLFWGEDVMKFVPQALSTGEIGLGSPGGPSQFTCSKSFMR
jgi:hypothetical protein